MIFTLAWTLVMNFWWETHKSDAVSFSVNHVSSLLISICLNIGSYNLVKVASTRLTHQKPTVSAQEPV